MSDPALPFPVAVVGCGRMGRLHARVYSQLPGVALVAVFDRDRSVAEAVAAEHGGRAVDSIDAVIAAGARAATVAVPTVHHLDAAAR